MSKILLNIKSKFKGEAVVSGCRKSPIIYNIIDKYGSCV